MKTNDEKIPVQSQIVCEKDVYYFVYKRRCIRIAFIFLVLNLFFILSLSFMFFHLKCFAFRYVHKRFEYIQRISDQTRRRNMPFGDLKTLVSVGKNMVSDFSLPVSQSLEKNSVGHDFVFFSIVFLTHSLYCVCLCSAYI